MVRTQPLHTGAGSTRRGPESQVGGRCPVLLARIRTGWASLVASGPPFATPSTVALQPMAPEQWEAVVRRSRPVPSEKAKQSKMVRVRVPKAPKWLRRIRGMPGQPTQDASNYLALTKLHEPLVNNMFSGRAARGAQREQETRVITTRWPSGRKPL